MKNIRIVKSVPAEGQEKLPMGMMGETYQEINDTEYKKLVDSEERKAMKQKEEIYINVPNEGFMIINTGEYEIV